jgi:hypothetical protein
MHRFLAIAALVAWLAPAVAIAQAPAPVTGDSTSPASPAAEQAAGTSADAPAGAPPAGAPDDQPDGQPDNQPDGQPDGQPAEPAPIIELWTMGPGEMIWEKYGHIALCVRDPDPRRDRCYNYGTTDFSDPVTLVWDFLRNRSKFWVSETTPTRILRFYRDVLDRSVWVQRLPLSPEKARMAAAMLDANTRSEDKYYRYHHYDDNCSTRVRDIIDRVTDGALSQATEPYEYTLRELTRQGLSEYPALVLLSDFPLGRRADRYPNMFEAMHIPLFLRDAVTTRLGVQPETIYERKGRPFDISHPLSRVWLLVIALVVAVPALVTWRLGRFQRAGLMLSLLPAGLLASLMWFMAIISTLPEIRWNETLLVLWPTDLALPWLPARWRTQYARVRVGWLALMLVLSLVGVLRQPLWAVIAFPLLPCAIAVLAGRQAATPAAATETPASARPAGKQGPQGKRGKRRSGR